MIVKAEIRTPPRFGKDLPFFGKDLPFFGNDIPHELTKAPFDLLPYEALLQFHARAFQSRARGRMASFTT